MKKKIAVSLLSLTMLTGGIVPTYAEPNTLNSIRSDIDTSNVSKTSLMKEVTDLDKELSNASNEVDRLNNEVAKVEKEISDLKEEIVKKEAEYKQLQADFGSRLEAMYKNGSIGYVQVVLDSESIEDLFARVDMLKELLGNDKENLTKLEQQKQELNDSRSKLDNKQSEVKKAKEDAVAKKDSIVAKKKEKDDMIAKIEREEARVAAANSATASRAGSSVDRQQNNSGASQSSSASSAPAMAPAPSGNGGGVIGLAMAQLGKPYVWGATGPNSFDCSGFVQYVFRQAGVSLPRVTSSQENVGTAVSVSQLAPGDLVFWGSPSYHVGIYIGGGQYIHAPQTGDVVKVAPLRSGVSKARRVI